MTIIMLGDPSSPFFEFKVEEVIKSPMFFWGGTDHGIWQRDKEKT